MGRANKLTTPWRGKPLVRHVWDAAAGSKLSPLVVVTGHESDAVQAALPAGVHSVHNSDFESGMAGSIRSGIYRLQGHMPVVILLGDMPLVTKDHIDALIAAFEAAGSDKAIVVSTCDGNPGNPVLFGKAHFAALKMLEGDQGAKSVVAAQAGNVIKIEIGEAGRRDFDTPDMFEL